MSLDMHLSVRSTMNIIDDDCSKENFHLVHPDETYHDEIDNYRKVFMKKHSSMDGTSFLDEYEDISAWIALQNKLQEGKDIPEGLVSSDEYLYVRESDHKVTGMLNIRHNLNEYLSLYGGHIGYSVLPSERRRGIATRMLKDALPLCRNLGMDKILITCHKGNEGSRKVILHNGGFYEGDIVYQNVIIERYWIYL